MAQCVTWSAVVLSEVSHTPQDGGNIVFARAITRNNSGAHLAGIVRALQADDARAQRIAEV